MLLAIWDALLWPFRAIGRAVEAAGRVTVGIVGFVLMVMGVAMLAGAYYLVGLAVILFGLVLMLRSF
ncbi:MAG: hypothetical protein U0800_20375 [Isosphaeraceae bacterium]